MSSDSWPKPETVVFNKDQILDEQKSRLNFSQLFCVVIVISEALLALKKFNNIDKAYNITVWVFRFLNSTDKRKKIMFIHQSRN